MMGEAGRVSMPAQTPPWPSMLLVLYMLVTYPTASGDGTRATVTGVGVGVRVGVCVGVDVGVRVGVNVAVGVGVGVVVSEDGEEVGIVVAVAPPY